MKKFLLLCLILSALGTGCGAKDAAESPADIGGTGKNTGEAQEKEDPSSPIKTAVQKPEGDAPWIAAYFDLVKTLDGNKEELLLTDIDLDGIPELFLGRSQGDHSWLSNLYHGYSYKDGTVTDINLPEQARWTSLELYKKKENGELVWIADSLSTPEKGRDKCSKDAVDFSNFSNVTQTPLLEWAEVDSDASKPNQTKYYMLPDHAEITREQLDKAKKELLSQYKNQHALYLTGFTPELCDYDPDTDSLVLSEDLFYSFYRLYDETAWENFENGDDPNYRHVYSIEADLTTGYGDQKGFPAAITREFSDIEKDGQSGLLWVNQLIQGPDPEIQKTINEKIESQAVSAIVKGNYKGAFQVSQKPFVYENFLSVLQENRCTESETGISKRYSKAVAYNMETGEVAKLSDIVTFDDKLKEKIYAGGFHNNNRLTHEECLEQGLYDKLWSLMTDPELKEQFYMSDYSCGFIVDLSPQNNVCFTISTSELKDYIR